MSDSAKENTVEIVETPYQVSRLLGLLPDGRSYLATWLRLKATVRKTVGEDGKDVILNQPLTEYRTELVVLTLDTKGELERWGAMGAQLPDEWDVRLRYQPPSNLLLSPPGYKRLVGADDGPEFIPDPSRLFSQIVDVFDTFLNFSFGIAEQRETAEMLAVFVLATWVSDAYAAFPYLWPNGDKGSGKTKTLMLVGALGYIGQVILAGGSYAALRDLAEYGATLCFDDAENLSDARNSDPDKRALLLAGNRKGAFVPVKEPEGKNGWRIRNVSAYCPKVFSAIRLPDPVLSRRTVVLPMVRSADEARANHDIEEDAYWPHDRRRLVDDLWAFGFHYLGRAREAYNASRAAEMVGPGFEPWRPLLATAQVLEDAGVEGLTKSMTKIARDYHQEKGDLEYPDDTRLAVMAIAEIADVRTFSDKSDVFLRPEEASEKVRFTASDVASRMNTAAREEGLTDGEEDYTNAKKVGHILKRLRIKADRETGKKRTRNRIITKGDAFKLMRAYGVRNDVEPSESAGDSGEDVPDDPLYKTSETSENVQSSVNGHRPIVEACVWCHGPLPDDHPTTCPDCLERIRNARASEVAS